MMKNPGKILSIYQIAELVKPAWLKAATPANILSGFAATGIWPFDKNIFPDDYLLPSLLTDRPVVNTTEETTTAPETFSERHHQPSTSKAVSFSSAEGISTPPTPLTTIRAINETPNIANTFISPFAFKGLPKADQRKEESNKGRKRAKCTIATATPEMKRKRSEEQKKADKQNEQLMKKKAKPKKCQKTLIFLSDQEDFDIDHLLESDSDIDIILGDDND